MGQLKAEPVQAHPVLSAVDQQRFGVVTAKALCLDAAALADALRASRSLHAQLAIVRIPSSAWGCLDAAINAGGALKDILDFHDWQVCADDYAEPQDAAGEAISLGVPTDADALGVLAREAFFNYESHYHRDTRLDRSDATDVYPDWARNACVHATDESPVIVTRWGDRIVAFAALRRLTADILDVALFGVAGQVQGNGVGMRLMRHVQRFAFCSHAPLLTYSTQIENVAARRLVARCGFLPAYSLMTFHFWL
jgi:GNAT superfamily N-acetyltransferase